MNTVFTLLFPQKSKATARSAMSGYLSLLFAFLFISGAFNQANAAGCYNTTNGYGGGGTYQATGSGLAPICGNRSITTASTYYFQFDPISGASYTFTVNGATWSSGMCMTYYQYNGSAWAPAANSTGTTTSCSITFTASTSTASWGLVSVYNGTSCTSTGPAWPGTSATLTYTMNNNTAFTSSAGNICGNGSTRTLTATPAGGSFSFVSGVGSVSSPTYTAPSGATSAGTGTVQYNLLGCTVNQNIPVDATSSYGTISNTGPLTTCDNAGNVSSISVSGYRASTNLFWDWGKADGSVGGSPWVSGATCATSGSVFCCFPVNPGINGPGADRVRVTAQNGVCPSTTSGWVLVQNQNSPTPTSLTSTSYCTNTVPSSVTLTAALPSGGNSTADVTSTYSSVQFYSGGCGTGLLGTVTPTGTPPSSASITLTGANIPTAAGTYTYWARETSSCETSNCVTGTITVNSLPAITNVTASASNPICATSTVTLTANGVSGSGAGVTWWTGTGGTGSQLGTGTTLSAGPDQTYYARVTGTCNTPTEANYTVTLESTAPSITAPANISTKNSPNNSGMVAEVFSTPTVTDNCASEGVGGINVLPGFGSSLQLWVKADAGIVKDAAGNVAEWRDLSGNAHHFVQPTVASRPSVVTNSLFGQNVVRMSTTNNSSATASKYMYTNYNFSSSTYTIFAVTRMNGTNSTFGTTTATNSRLVSSASTNWLFGNWGSGQNQFYANNWISNPSTLADANAHMYCATVTNTPSNNTSFYDYGVAIVSGSTTAASAIGQLELSGYQLGSEFSNGDVAEVIVYNTVLTAAQRQIIEGYLAYKYNLSVPLASAQAFQTYANATNTTVNFIGSDQGGNTVTTTSTASGTSYPGPVVATPSTVCEGTNVSLTVTGMAPAGKSATTNASGDWVNISGTPLSASGNAVAGPSAPTPGATWTFTEWFQYPFSSAPGFGSWNTIVRGPNNHHIIVQRNSATSLLLGVYCSTGCAGSGSGFVSSGYNFAQTGSTLSTGWHHLAAVGSGGTTSFYIDGVKVGVSTAEVTEAFVSLGAYQGTSTAGTGASQNQGQFDEVKIYNTAISQNSISNLMTQTSSVSTDPNYGNLIAYYKFDGNGTNTVSGNYTANTYGSAAFTTSTSFYTYNWAGPGSPTFANTASTTLETQTVTSTTNANSGSYTVYATANGVNSATTTIPVQIDAQPILTIPTATCSNLTAALSSSVSVNWSVSSGTVSPTSGANTTFTPGTITPPTQNATISITAVNGTCTANSTIRVDDRNSISSPPTALCNNSATATISGNVSGVSWTTSAGSFSPASGQNSTLTLPSIAPPTQNTTITVSATNGVCSAATATIRIDDVNSIVSPPAAVCNAAGTVAINGNVPGISWSSSTGSVSPSTGQNTTFTVPTVNPPVQSVNVTISATNGACPAATAVVRVDNQNSITSPPSAICNNGNTTLNGNVNGVAWSTSGGSVSPASGQNTTLTPPSITAPTANTTITVSATNGVCTTATATIQVDAQNSITSPPTALCDNTGTTTINGTTSGVVWSVNQASGIGGSSVTSPGQNTTLTVGDVAGQTNANANITLTATNGTCSANTIIRIDNKPVISAGTDISQCNNSVFTLNATPNPVAWGTPAWSCVSNCAGVTIGTPTSPTSQVSGITVNNTSQLQWTITNGTCSTSSTVNLRNDNQPSVTGPTSPCVNDVNVQYNASGTGTSPAPVWSVTPSSAGTISSVGTFNANPIAGSTISIPMTVNLQNGTCSATYGTTLYNQAYINGIPNMCETDPPVILSANINGNTVYSGTGLSFTGTGVSFNSGTGKYSFSPPAPSGNSQNFTITLHMGASDCGDVAIITVYKNVNPASAGPDQHQCQNGSFNITGSTPTVGTGTWQIVSGVGTIGNANLTSTTVTGVPVGTSVTLSWTVANGVCNSSSQVTLYNDDVPTTANAGPDQEVCNNSTFTLAANTPTVGTGLWSVVSGPGSISNPASPTSTISGVNTGNPTPTILQWTISSGACTASSDQVSVQSDAIPTQSNAGADQEQCNTSTFTMAANPPGINLAAWSVVSGTGTVTNPTSPFSTVTGVVAGTTTVLQWTISNGVCPSSSTTVNLQNDLQPTPSNAGANQQQCNTSTFTLNGNQPTLGIGMWSKVSGPGTITTPSAYNTTVTGVTAGASTVLRWTITNGVCTSSSTVTVQNDALPTTSNAGSDQVNCNNSTFTVTGNAPTTGSGVWSIVSGPGTITAPTSTVTTVTGVTPGSTTVLQWTVTNGTCSSSSQVSLYNDNISANATNTGPYALTQNILLFSGSAGGVQPYNYTWSGVNGFSDNVSDPVKNNAQFADAGPYDVTVIDADGCSATSTTVVQVGPTTVYVWTGTTSTAWNTTTNWNPVSPPGGPNGCTADVYIPLTPNQPVVSSTVGVGNIHINGGAKVTLNSADLDVCLNLTGGFSGLYGTVTGNGNLVLDGNSLQTISGNIRIDEMKLDNAFNAILSSNAVIEIFTALDLKKGNFNASAGNMTFRSTSVNNAAIIDNFSAGYTGTFNGTIKAQRYYQASVSYNQHFLGSPVNSPAIQQLGPSGTAGYIIATATCDETQIAPGSPYSTVMTLDESHGATCTSAQWIALTSGSGNMQNGRGYTVAKPGSGVLTLTGAPNLNSSYSVSGCTNSNWSNTTLQGHTVTSGWSLVTNPYLASLNITTVNPGFDNQIQVWNCNGPFAGSYQPGIVGVNATLAPFQAFMVHKTTPGGTATYTINASDRSRTPQTYFQANDHELKILATNTTTGLMDQTTVAFNTTATDQFDSQIDANKSPGQLNRHTLYSVNNGQWMSINTLHDIAQTSTVPVGFEPGKTDNYTFNFQGVNTFDPTSYIYLEDKKLGVMYDVRKGDYNFTADSADAWDRFVLHFTPAAEFSTTDAGCVTQGHISVTQPGTASWNYNLTDANNNSVSTGMLSQYSPLNIDVAAGTYTLTLVDNNNYTATQVLQVNGVQPITASFNASSTNVTEMQNVVLTSTTTGATNYQWNFGNGQTATGQSVSVDYGTAGTYTVVLTVSNLSGCTATASQVITVASVATGLGNVIENKGIGIWSSENNVFVDFRQLDKVNAVISIYNVLGQQISNEKFTSNTLYKKEIGNIEAAYLIISVKNDGKTTTKKVFITNTK